MKYLAVTQQLVVSVAQYVRQWANGRKPMQLKLLNYCLNALIASTVLFSALAPVQAADKKSNILISLRGHGREKRKARI